MKRAQHINEVERRGFSVCDYPELKPENFRQYIYKLRNYIELHFHSYPNFYNIKGVDIRTNHKSTKNLFYNSLGDNMLTIFENLTTQSLVLTNIKLSFISGRKFYKCLNNINEKFDEQTNPVVWEHVTVGNDYDIRIEVFPKITYVSIKGRNGPILHDVLGVLKLTETLGIISGILYHSTLNIIQIPSICDWKCISYSLGKDARYFYDDPKYHRTWKDMMGGFLKMFCKWEKDESLDDIFDKTHCCSPTIDQPQVAK